MTQPTLAPAAAPEMVWIYDDQYRRQYQTALAAAAVQHLAQRFGGYKALVPCEEVVAAARDQDHHLHGLFLNPRELVQSPNRAL
jgi:hypothetical protein